ncbi:hypothetical protein EVAR_346_1 [Eumeta japonica]|uniref:Uncharacterized protein n=1 Tax=Eumeta variegata TaxID=151549 RepID=A0A4C1SCM6_EUMVA|nr:hypothetical protein EVAR_346_1 [Eumeta japonica]
MRLAEDLKGFPAPDTPCQRHSGARAGASRARVQNDKSGVRPYSLKFHLLYLHLFFLHAFKIEWQVVGYDWDARYKNIVSLAPVKIVAFTMCLPSSLTCNRVPLHNLGASRLRINKTDSEKLDQLVRLPTPQHDKIGVKEPYLLVGVQAAFTNF